MNLGSVVFEGIFERFPIDGHASQRRTAGSVVLHHGSSFLNRLPSSWAASPGRELSAMRRAVPHKSSSLADVPANTRLRVKKHLAHEPWSQIRPIFGSVRR